MSAAMAGPASTDMMAAVAIHCDFMIGPDFFRTAMILSPAPTVGCCLRATSRENAGDIQLLEAVVRRSTFWRAVLVFLLDHRNRIGAGEPAVEIDVGAALGAEWPMPLNRRLAADRAFRGFGHGLYLV